MAERDPSGPSYADSLEGAQQGDTLLVDRRGHVVGKRAIWRHRVAIAAGALGGGAASVWFAGVTAGIAGTAVGLVFAVFVHRRAFSSLRLVHSVRNEPLEVAWAALREFPRDRLSPAKQPLLLVLEGEMWMRSKEPERAAASLQAAVRQYESFASHSKEMWYWLARFSLCSSLARLRRIEEAVAARPQPERVPDGEIFVLLHHYAGIELAFYADDDRFLPPEDDLHQQGKLALRSNVLGSTLVLVAWAFERAGDADLAEHFLRESQSRLDRPLLEAWSPEIVAWMDQRLASIE